jgi:hypothetical protein
MHDLFEQLGLPSEEADIRRFMSRQPKLPDTVRLADAPFWSASQAQFLREEILQDADWAEVVDQLNLALKK